MVNSERPAKMLLVDVSIVVPVGPGDELWRRLLTCLAKLPLACEIHLVAAEFEPDTFEEFVAACGIRCPTYWFRATQGRGCQLNTGIARSTGRFVWLLHADSLLHQDAVAALDRALQTAPEAIHYFDLRFASERVTLMKLNSWGVWFRSHCLGLPFGDQGLCLSRETVERLGGFPETVAYGEDHLLIWAAHRHRVPVRAVGSTIETSARKYEQQGWLRTTSLHFCRTWAQAFPQWLALIWSRLR
jgi:hypothetical protein